MKNRNRLSFILAAIGFMTIVVLIAAVLVSLVSVDWKDGFSSDFAFWAALGLLSGVIGMFSFYIGKAWQKVLDEEYEQEMEDAYMRYMEEHFCPPDPDDVENPGDNY